MIVVDCAAVVDALTGVDGTDDLRAVLATEELSAPALLDFEVVSALRGLTHRGDLTAARAEDALTDFDDLDVRGGRRVIPFDAERSSSATACPPTWSWPTHSTVHY